MLWQEWPQFALRKEKKKKRKKKNQHWATQVACKKLQLMYLGKWKEWG